MDFEKLYFMMFNQMSRAIEAMNAGNFGIARDILIKAQQDGEEAYLSEGEEE